MTISDKKREALELPNFIYSDPIGHAYAIEVAGDIAREALEFYADPTNWVSGDVPGHVYAIEDAGGIAREALKSQPKMEPVGWWDGDSRFTRHETLPQKHSWDIVHPLYIVPPAPLHSAEAEREPDWIGCEERMPARHEYDMACFIETYCCGKKEIEICFGADVVSEYMDDFCTIVKWMPTGVRRPPHQETKESAHNLDGSRNWIRCDDCPPGDSDIAWVWWPGHPDWHLTNVSPATGAMIKSLSAALNGVQYMPVPLSRPEPPEEDQ